jgi:predicted ATPase
MSEASEKPAPVEVFFSYSHRDEKLRDELEKHLSILKRQGVIAGWHDRKIGAGGEWARAIDDALGSASLILLLVSADFLASDYCYDVEMTRAMERHESGEARVIPILLHDCDWSAAPFGKLQALPTDAHPVTGRRWKNRAEAFADIARGIREAVAALPARQPAPRDGAAPIAPPAAPRHNLPASVTSFVGREREMAEVRERLAATRLLTLTGAGGTGKTRLLLEVAAELSGEYPEGAWLVELAPLADESLVTQEIAAALGVREEPGRPLLGTVSDFLRSRTLLLLLDNCEHLLSACATAASVIGRACPGVRILASSREPLGIAGEALYPVPSLSLPEPARGPLSAGQVEALAGFEAMRLFAERAAAVQPAFALTAANAAAVIQICRRLDGIPLAVELAAARVRALPVAQIAARLDDCFRLLTGGSRTALPRQQTLRALIDWSYDLLSDAERLLLRRLSVFAGGWTLEAAEAVCAGDGIEDREILDLLSELVDKSLVVYEEQDEGSARYRLLETVRRYAEDRLGESGEAGALRAGHRGFYRRLLEEPANHPEALELEHRNLWAALEGALVDGAVAEATAMSVALADFWESRGLFREGSLAFSRCLAGQDALPDTRLRARLLLAASWFAYLQADYPKAESLARDSLALWREVGEAAGEANALNNLALAAQAQGRFGEARERFGASLALVRDGDEQEAAKRLSNLGLLEIEEGLFPEAADHLQKALSIYTRRQDSLGRAACLCNLADLALRRSEWTEVERLARQSLELFGGMEHQAGIAVSLGNLAAAAAGRGDHVLAERQIHEALCLCAEIGMQNMIPPLLDLRARGQAAQGAAGPALFCFAAADKLREGLGLPATGEGEREALEARVLAALGEDAAFAVRSRVALLDTEAILAEALRSCPGGV